MVNSRDRAPFFVGGPVSRRLAHPAFEVGVAQSSTVFAH